VASLRGPAEGGRCLSCQDVCEICAEVCPNRANVAISVPGLTDPRQIIHIDGLCNECGTCGTFCPHAGLPYRDKLTVFWSPAAFEASGNVGLLRTGEQRYRVRLPGGGVLEQVRSDGGPSPVLPPGVDRVLASLETRYPYLLAPTLTQPETVATKEGES
jgi:putative selenate reductase